MSQPPSLRNLLGECSPQRFLAQMYDTRPWHAAGAARDLQLLSIAELERLLRRPGAGSTVPIQLRRDDRPVIRHADSLADICEALSNGFGLHIANFELMLEPEHPVITLARQLGDWLAVPLRGVSVFLSPADSDTLTLHKDDEDIFTVQLEGTKRWEILPRLPHKASLVADVDDDAPEQTVSLCAGDALYLPRRTPHRVHATGAPALSLGFAFRLPDWGETLVACLESMTSREPALAASPPAAGAPVNEDTLGAARTTLHRLVDALDVAVLEQHMARQRARRQQVASPPVDILVAAMGAHLITAGSRLLVVDPDSLQLSRAGGRMLLRHGNGARLSAPAKARQVLEDIGRTRSPFTPDALHPSLDVPGRVALCRKLVRLGVLVPC